MQTQAAVDKRSILIIDDTPMILRSLSQLLKDDYDVSVTKSAIGGIQMACQTVPDLILLDLVMPEMSGFEVLDALKASDATKDIAVVFITGSEVAEDEEKGYKLGVLDYIRKPFVEGIVKHRVWFALEFVRMRRALGQVGG